jgi:hypothetical protein
MDDRDKEQLEAALLCTLSGFANTHEQDVEFVYSMDHGRPAVDFHVFPLSEDGPEGARIRLNLPNIGRLTECDIEYYQSRLALALNTTIYVFMNPDQAWRVKSIVSAANMRATATVH